MVQFELQRAVQISQFAYQNLATTNGFAYDSTIQQFVLWLMGNGANARLYAQGVFGGGGSTGWPGIAGLTTKIDKNQATDGDVV